MQTPTEPAHIRRAENALVCLVCKKTKEIRPRTTQENLDAWQQEHARCRPVRK